MSILERPEGGIHYQLDGPANAPVLVLSNSLGTNFHMWEAQMSAFAKHFRVLRYDTRGHGSSTVTEGPCAVEQLGRDVLELLDHLSIEQVAICGLSMGGLIAQWLAVNAPERITRLILCNTAAKIGTEEVWNDRIDTVLRGGSGAMIAMGDAALGRWFTPAFVESQPEECARIVGMLAATSPIGYAGSCAAVRDADFRQSLGEVRCPVLIICGNADPVTTTEHGRQMQAMLGNAELIELHAAHLSNVEAHADFTRHVLGFLQTHPGT